MINDFLEWNKSTGSADGTLLEPAGPAPVVEAENDVDEDLPTASVEVYEMCYVLCPECYRVAFESSEELPNVGDKMTCPHCQTIFLVNGRFIESD